MKQLILPLIVLLITSSAHAQIEYESPHVKEGKTMQFNLPEGYFAVKNGTLDGSAIYASKDGLDLEIDEIEALPVGMIAVMHVATEKQTLEMFKNEISEELIAENEGIIILGEPEIVKIKGRDCIYAGFKGELDEETIGGLYFGAIEHGDYFILITYLATWENLENLLSYDDFKKIMTTWKEVATEKEDGFKITEEEEWMETMDNFEDILESLYLNDLFETELTYYDVLPDLTADWEEPSDENSHLLSEFTYKKSHGRIKVFSGGSAANYPSEEEMADAIELVTGRKRGMSLVFNSKFSNEDHVFRLYTISGGGTISSVYTAIVNNEMVFFVVDGGLDPVENFKPAVRELMLTMWVDYFVEAETLEEK